MMKGSKWLCCVVLVLASGCSSYGYRYSGEKEQQLLDEAMGKPSEEPLATPLALDDDARHVLDERIGSRVGDAQKLRALRDFLFNKDGLDIHYNAGFTRTAMGVWQSHNGNCLSLTNLFIASARYVGMNARYETVEVRPTWDQEGSTMVRYEHIIAVGSLRGGQQYTVDFLPEFALDRRRTSLVSDDEALALFYNNLGAEKVVVGDYNGAIADLQRAIRVDGGLSDAWNNLGAAFRRIGRDDLAEFSYQRSVRFDADNYSALSNLAQLYQAKGDTEAAAYFQGKVHRYRELNPYYHYFLAHNLYLGGDYHGAIAQLEHAVRIKPDEPDFYTALSQSYEKLGDEARKNRYASLAEKYKDQLTQPAHGARSHDFYIQGHVSLSYGD